MSDKNDSGPTPLDLESLRAALDAMSAAAKRLRIGVEGPCVADELDKGRAAFDELLAELTARRAREEAVEAIAAADNTLHSAMDHWQERAIRAEAALRARDAEVAELVTAANNVNALSMQTDAHKQLRTALRPFHPSGSDAEGESK